MSTFLIRRHKERVAELRKEAEKKSAPKAVEKKAPAKKKGDK